MINYAQMRRNMVAGQLQTNGIIAPEIVNAFEAVPRELFLPEMLRGAAYVDEDVPLPAGGFMPEPLVIAKMIMALRAPGAEVVLCIGDVTGYVAALLSQMVTTVVALESKPKQLESARRAWTQLDICNVAVAKGSGRRGCPEHAPYELIMICGAVDHVPEDLLHQLASGGRLATVIREQGSGVGHIALFEKDDDGHCHGGQRFSDAATFFAEDFKEESSFVF